jgi:hypothetical protein
MGNSIQHDIINILDKCSKSRFQYQLIVGGEIDERAHVKLIGPISTICGSGATFLDAMVDMVKNIEWLKNE